MGARCKWAMLERDGYHIELFAWMTPKGEPVPIRQCDLGYTHIAWPRAYVSGKPQLEAGFARERALQTATKGD